MGGPLADYAGRRIGMATGAVAVIIATFMLTFAPNLGCFIAGRVVIGIGQGLALSTIAPSHHFTHRVEKIPTNANKSQLPVPFTLASLHPQRSAAKSCRFGKCFIRSEVSSRTGSTTAAPNTKPDWVNGTGGWW